jgi:hypothetical protein
MGRLRRECCGFVKGSFSAGCAPSVSGGGDDIRVVFPDIYVLKLDFLRQRSPISPYNTASQMRDRLYPVISRITPRSSKVAR